MCRKELLDASIEAGGGLFSRLAGIVKEHGAGDETLSRNCCALLAGFSYMPESHEGLSSEDVMETLFLTTKSDDVLRIFNEFKKVDETLEPYLSSLKLLMISCKGCVVKQIRHDLSMMEG